MDYVLILLSFYSITTAEFFTKPACEDAGKAYVQKQRELGNHHTDYICQPKAQNYRAQHEQE